MTSVIILPKRKGYTNRSINQFLKIPQGKEEMI